MSRKFALLFAILFAMSTTLVQAQVGDDHGGRQEDRETEIRQENKQSDHEAERQSDRREDRQQDRRETEDRHEPEARGQEQEVRGREVETRQRGKSTPATDGDYTATDRRIAIVREVDFRGPQPAVFIRIQHIEPGESIRFGKDAITRGSNRDAWIFDPGTTLEDVNQQAKEVALADFRGNIPNSVVWFKLQCANEQITASRFLNVEVKHFGTEIPTPFAKVKEDMDDVFNAVCEVKN